MRRPQVGLAGLGVFGAIAVAALTRPTASAVDALPATAGAAAGALALVLVRRRLLAVGDDGAAASGDTRATNADGVPRRRFLVGTSVAFGVAAAAGVVGQFFPPLPGGRIARPRRRTGQRRRRSTRARRVRPRRRRVEPVLHAERRLLPHRHGAARADADRGGVARRVHGMVGREITLDFDELMARP